MCQPMLALAAISNFAWQLLVLIYIYHVFRKLHKINGGIDTITRTLLIASDDDDDSDEDADDIEARRCYAPMTWVPTAYAHTLA